MNKIIITLFLLVFSISSNLQAGNNQQNDNANANSSCNLQIAFEYAVDGLEVKFTNVSSGDYDTIRWTFGDNNVSKEESPSHKYKKEGPYTFCLTATNVKKKCKEEFCGEVYVFE